MYFKKSVEVHSDIPVITNPDNQLVVNNQIKRVGKRYITFRTVFNYIMSFFR